MTEKLKYNYTDTGNCRVYYTWKNSKGQKVSYCAMDNGYNGIPDIKFYRCSGGDWDEPEYTVNPLEAPPLSPGNTEIDKAVNDWINNKWNNVQSITT